MKKKLMIIAIAALTLTGCGKSIPKLENGQEAMVEYADGTKISVDEVKKLRRNAIMDYDKGATSRISSQNKFMTELYNTYLKDRKLAHKLFHWRDE